jgi:photosystem II stability/assembly factor-like uncharacterized protein
MNRKLLFPALLLFATLLACRIGGTGTPPVTVTPTLPPLPVVPSPALMSFRMLDASNGWGTTEAKLVRTDDGGATWYNATPSGVSSVGYAATFYLNTSTAWLSIGDTAFSSGTLYHTTDGGATWNSVSVPFYDGGLQFLDPANGWVLAGLGAGAGSEAVAVFNTTDGGTTWTRLYVNDPNVPGAGDSLPLGGQKTGMTFLDATHGWVSGAEPMDDYVYLFASLDGGHTWAHQDLALPTGYAGGQTVADAPVFFGTTEAVLPVGVFATDNGRVFYLSHDSGVTWTAGTPVTFGRNYSIASLSDLFVWDGGATMNVSHDSGLSWSTVSPNIVVTDTLSNFQFVSATTGWALTSDASYHAIFYKTTDGGTTWTVLIP